MNLVAEDIDAEEVESVSNALSFGRAVAARALKESLLDFTRQAWLILEPEQQFVENWHVVELCTLLETLASSLIGRATLSTEEIERAIINVPPGTMKSLLVSIIFPCWLWANNPKLRILTAAYSDKRALDANLKARTLMKSEWFQSLFSLEFTDDSNTKGRFDTKQGGWRIATSVGGEGTGLHPDLIIIDDAATAADAQSETERKRVNSWYSGTVSSRGVSRGVRVIVIGQRLHEEDLPGFLLARDRKSWTLVRWPMRFELCTCLPDCSEQDRCALHKADKDWTPDPRDHRKVEGELLFPQLFTEAKVLKLEIDLGPYDTAGQLQQRPAPEGGGLFKREWFKYVDVGPKIARRVRGWDTAATEGDGDWTVGVKIAEEFDWVMEDYQGRPMRRLKSTGNFFVEDVVRVQLGPDDVDKLMLATAQSDGKLVAQREEREGGASGKAVIAARRRTLKGYNYEEVQLGGGKIIRAKPFRTQCHGGNVYLVRGPWNEQYVSELSVFPTGKHDDDVDGSSAAFNSVVLEPPPQTLKSASW